MNCFAEPVIGRAFARPVGSHDVETAVQANVPPTRHAKVDCFVACAPRNVESNVARTDN
jgi:hypothetical protein